MIARSEAILLSCLWACFATALSAAAAEPWRAVEQPELKDALEGAPVLQTESLGEPARGGEKGIRSPIVC